MSTDRGRGPMPPAVLRLAPRAESVREARHFLRELLRTAERERWTDAAELALSEIVTNGVLHAHTELTLRVSLTGEVLRVEVADGNPTLPVQRRAYDAEATTGRGLELVAAMVQECGVRPEPSGKVVWFTVSDVPSAGQEEADLLAAWDDHAWDDHAWDDHAGDDGEWQRPPTPDLRQVVLQRMPTTLWMAARDHHHAMLRELVLYVAEHEDGAAQLPDLALADRARHLIWIGLLAEIDRARSDGRARRPLPENHPSPLPEVPQEVDLRLDVPADMASAFAAMQDALDVGERLAVEDLLLVRPGLPEIIAVRDWACEQVVAQLAGVPASPWPGTDSSHFLDSVHDRQTAPGPDWDTTLVTSSDRGVVAADDANRIVAISDVLARTIGWEAAELVGRRVVALVPPELREAHVAGFSRHLTTGQAHVLGVPLELPVLRRDGTTIRCSFLIERAEVGSRRQIYLAWVEPVSE